ncbi:alpha/beta hydrolase [Actinoplanes sp. TBRC 11911]|nr:alpha/beta hydrolase [Actinoplanes sp. TBRC 11911]
MQCGTMKVPADWADPYGASISLTIARRLATDPEHRIGALFVNPGGPGASAVDFAFDAPTFFSAAVRARFDIVGMDPRGVGRSSPVVCSQRLIDAEPSPLIDSEDAYAKTIDYNRKLAADCAARTGPHFAHVDSASVVHDMDAVRAALGEEKINFYGASYGTLIGAEYAQTYPSRLRALVLDSVMDHSVGLARFLLDATGAAQDAFNQFVDWCARDKKCVLRGQDIRAIWARLADRARAGTLTDPYDPDSTVSMNDLIGAAFAAFYDPQWYSFAYYLRDSAKQAPPVPESRASTPPLSDDTPNSFPAIFCEDWYLPITGYPDLRRRLNILAERAPQMLASPLALSATTGCLGWPSAPDNPQRPLIPPRGIGPILVVAARHDPATAYGWAGEVARQLGPTARLLTYRGWGHVVYKRSPCAAGLVDRYLITLTTPAAGSSCKAIEPQPFGVG